jgi:hypothetical protein
MGTGSIGVLFIASLLAACSAAQSPISAVPPVAADKARIYVYRTVAPYEPALFTTVAFNGQPVGTTAPGSAFFRDVAPGTYVVAARSFGASPFPPQTVAAAPGGTTFVRIGALQQNSLADVKTIFVPDLVDPEVGRREIARLPLSPG